MGWSVRPTKPEFQQKEPIVLTYEFFNHWNRDVFVPKLVNSFASIRFRLNDPSGHRMSWTGSLFTFGYVPSDMVKLAPGQKISGTFAIPRACPGESKVEKGGFCFQMAGVYEGTAEFRLGLNAVYHRNQFPGQLAEGPYSSNKFTFTIR